MLDNVPKHASVVAGFSPPPWESGAIGIMTGIPVMISDDPAWPVDHWALLEDGVVVASGYGDPIQPQLPRGS